LRFYDHGFSVDFLEKLEVPLYKIASFELTHHPLIRYVAGKGKPMIMSTGLASLEEIKEAVRVAQDGGCKDLTLLHCVSSYPAAVEDTNLATMIELKRLFPGIKIGLSDHTLGTTVAVAAAALGAEVIEKHVTLARADGGVDSAFSLEPHELKVLCEETKRAHQSIGAVNFERSKAELGNKAFRRSVYAVKDIKTGDVFNAENIRIIRPGYGVAPKNYSAMIGKKALVDIEFGSPIQMDMFDVA